MEQFSLEKYLENPSRKVVTRDGRQVRIVCWDLKSNTPIIAAIQWNQEREDCYCYNTIGRCANNIGELDLFFADEEEELTEFEKVVQNILNEPHYQDIQAVKQWSKTLLDLARKELNLVDNTCGEYALNEAYKQGKQDALKDLPKWKKVPKTWNIEDNQKVVFSEDYKYYIDKKELFNKLPKE